MTIIAFIIGLFVHSVLVFAVVSLVGNLIVSLVSVLFFTRATIPDNIAERTLVDRRIARGEASIGDVNGKILQLFIVATLFRPPLFWQVVYLGITIAICA